ncbi:MAG TPA: glycosyltransferase [Candidatus Saccharimonadales bacterium]|nr:glycosyltransferase [Candidatus Saccharimonadales bacterium]
MKVDFCIPIKNETQVLEVNLLKLLTYLENLKVEYSWKIIGAVNGSNDDSTTILRRLKDRFPDKIDYLEITEQGKGRAIKTCWRQSDADVLAFMDADLAVSLMSLSQLIDPILEGRADLVVGSRFMPGAVANRSWQRGLVSKSYALFSRVIMGHDKSDLQCGFKAISRSVYQKIDKFLKDDLWFLDTELVVLSELIGARILEIPVSWQENRQGKSKSNINILKDSWSFVLKILIFRRQIAKIKKYLGNV